MEGTTGKPDVIHLGLVLNRETKLQNPKALFENSKSSPATWCRFKRNLFLKIRAEIEPCPTQSLDTKCWLWGIVGDISVVVESQEEEEVHPCFVVLTVWVSGKVDVDQGWN